MLWLSFGLPLTAAVPQGELRIYFVYDDFNIHGFLPGNHTGTCTLRVVSRGNWLASRKSIINRPILEENVPMNTSASRSI